MALVLKMKGKFIPAPAGSHVATCVDVIDLGPQKVEFGGKTKMQDMVRFVFQLAERMPDGRSFFVSQRLTASLHDRSGLRKLLVALLGRDLTDDELNGGIDLENFIGTA